MDPESAWSLYLEDPKSKGFSLGFRVNSFRGLGLRDGNPKTGNPNNIVGIWWEHTYQVLLFL